MSKPILSDQDYGSVARILNLPDPTLAQHPATKAYVDSLVEGLAWKDSVRVASTATINLAAPGANIDGIAMAANDRFLAKNQTAAAENGIYVWTGAATPATRAADASTSAELEQAISGVEEGTSAGTSFRQTTINFVLDTGAVAWTTAFSTASAATETLAGIAEIATQAETDAGTDDARMVTPLKLKTSKLFAKGLFLTIGDGSATSFNFDHNLNTRDVIVTIYKLTGNFDDVNADVTRPTVNRVTISMSAAPAANAYRIVVSGTAV